MTTSRPAGHALVEALIAQGVHTAFGVPGESFLAVLDGSCRTPIAGHAAVSGGRVRFRGLIAKPDGSALLECAREGAAADAVTLGADAGRELRQRGGADFFAPLPHPHAREASEGAG